MAASGVGKKELLSLPYIVGNMSYIYKGCGSGLSFIKFTVKINAFGTLI